MWNVVLQVLVIQVGRFTYEPEVGRTVKVKCPVHHPQTLDLKPEWFAQNAPIKRATYQLVAKVVHKGTTVMHLTVAEF